MDRFNRRDTINPISMEDIDDSNEWLVGRMGGSSGNVDDDDGDDDFVHLDDDLTWNVVARASGVEDPERLLRSNTAQNRMSSSSSSRKKGKVAVSSSRPRPPPPALHDSEDEVDIYLEHQSEEEYVSDGDKSMDGDDEEDVEEEEDEEMDEDLDDD